MLENFVKENYGKNLGQLSWKTFEQQSDQSGDLRPD